MIAAAKALLRSLQARLEPAVGSRIQELLWRCRHLYKRNWAEDYLATDHHPHRDQIVAAVGSFGPIRSLLEVGCASGANLLRLRRAFPALRLIGLDINPRAIRCGQRQFARDPAVALRVARVSELAALPSGSVDVVLFDAVLMFIAASEIEAALHHATRIARRGVVINDFHCQGPPHSRFAGGRWQHDFDWYLARGCPASSLERVASAFTGGDWDRAGALLTLRHAVGGS
jgi:SAM-dependent methyltransferase